MQGVAPLRHGRGEVEAEVDEVILPRRLTVVHAGREVDARSGVDELVSKIADFHGAGQRGFIQAAAEPAGEVAHLDVDLHPFAAAAVDAGPKGVVLRPRFAVAEAVDLAAEADPVERQGGARPQDRLQLAQLFEQDGRLLRRGVFDAAVADTGRQREQCQQEVPAGAVIVLQQLQRFRRPLLEETAKGRDQLRVGRRLVGRRHRRVGGGRQDHGRRRRRVVGLHRGGGAAGRGEARLRHRVVARPVLGARQRLVGQVWRPPLGRRVVGRLARVSADRGRVGPAREEAARQAAGAQAEEQGREPGSMRHSVTSPLAGGVPAQGRELPAGRGGVKGRTPRPRYRAHDMVCSWGRGGIHCPGQIRSLF